MFMLLLLVRVVAAQLIFQCASSSHIQSRGDLFLETDNGNVHTLVWIVRVLSNPTVSQYNLAVKIAHDVGLVYLGHIGFLFQYYVMVHPYFYVYKQIRKQCERKRRRHQHLLLSCSSFLPFKRIVMGIEQQLLQQFGVEQLQREVVRRRVKRSLPFADPLFGKQWHLINYFHPVFDLNITGVWEQNITGKGITVAIVDDGVDWMHPDLADNYDSRGSWDLNGNDPDPMPVANGKNEHGTRCAGEIAALPNHVCGVGVSFGSHVSAIRVLDGEMTDSLEAVAFTKNLHVNDIYSCSWGPDDNGKTVDGPHILSQEALLTGINMGRRGYGTIYVVASGNGGLHGDNCNFDGYANSIYTVTIGAVDELGHTPFYAEECAAMLAVSFSSGDKGLRSIVTTDLAPSHKPGCTLQHTGTSASAPLAAGLIALMLEMQPCLTWRDVQYIIVLTATVIDSGHAAWFINKAGLHHSHEHGFGAMNAWRLVSAAMVWESVPFLTTYNSDIQIVNAKILGILMDDITLTNVDLYASQLWLLEYVQVRLTIHHVKRADLEIRLFCPSGSQSVLGTRRPRDMSSDGFDNWIFTTVRCWGEEPYGKWILIIDDAVKNASRGTLLSWQLLLHGTPMTQSDFINRKRAVDKAANIKTLSRNTSSRCRPRQPLPEYTPLRHEWLKIMSVVGFMLLLCTLYQSVENVCCEVPSEDRIYERLHQNEEEAIVVENSSNMNDVHTNARTSQLLVDETLV